MIRIITLLIVTITAQTVFAWNNHADMTNSVLTEWIASNPLIAHDLTQSIQTESLEHFLETTRKTLPSQLNDIEKMLRSTQQSYPSLPDQLIYEPSQKECGDNLVLCFKKSLRINLNVPLPIVVYDPTEWYLHHIENAKRVSKASEIMLPTSLNELYKNFTLLPLGSYLKKSDAIVISSMQPDFGFDMHLYVDSNTSFGKEYHFGKQPLGAPTDFNSQILFHMSTYQDNPILLAYLPRLKEDYLEYRALLYFKLSRFAALNNHPYWSAVFLGWGLHYIQDITQPYHSVLTAGLDQPTLEKAIEALKKGNVKFLHDIISLQTNRHILLEKLIDYLLTSNDQTTNDYRAILKKALGNKLLDPTINECRVEPGYVRNYLNLKLVDESASYAEMLRQTLPAAFVDDPNFQADSFSDYPSLFNKMDNAKRDQFTQHVSKALTWFGAYTRNCIKEYVNPKR